MPKPDPVPPTEEDKKPRSSGAILCAMTAAGVGLIGGVLLKSSTVSSAGLPFPAHSSQDKDPLLCDAPSVGLVAPLVVPPVSPPPIPIRPELTRGVKMVKLDLSDVSIPLRDRMVSHIQHLQASITSTLETLEPNQSFASTYYLRDSSTGFGDSRILQNGTVFEKAGCNISVINSTLSVASIKQMRAERFDWWDGVSELPYFVAGCSLVVHPVNPHAPTVHFNYRYFEIRDPLDPNGPPKAWWFGGGTDLTPSYLYPEDVRHFHETYKKVCDSHDGGYYARFKGWCDEYFRIPHRGETRGVGGIFFDDLSDRAPEEIFNFVKDASNSFLTAYFPIVKMRSQQEWTEEEKRWQQLRRGRYAEFNLVIDRGTKFGLMMKEPRTESILMSLPLTARWEYQPTIGTVEGSREKELLDVLRSPRDWTS